MSIAQIIMLVVLIILVIRAPKEAIFIGVVAIIAALIIHGQWLIAIVIVFICYMVATEPKRKDWK